MIRVFIFSAIICLSNSLFAQDEAQLTVVQEGSGSGAKYGATNVDGTVVIPFMYETLYKFNKNGLAIAQLDRKLGIINKENKTIIPFQYYRLSTPSSSTNNMFIAQKEEDGMYGIINELNKTIIPFKYYRLFYSLDNLFIAQGEENGRYGIFDVADGEGKIIIPFKYYNLAYALDGLFVAQEQGSGMYGVIDIQETPIVPFENYSITYASDGLFIVKKEENGLYGVVNSTKKIILPFTFKYYLDVVEAVNYIVDIQKNIQSPTIDNKIVLEEKLKGYSDYLKKINQNGLFSYSAMDNTVVEQTDYTLIESKLIKFKDMYIAGQPIIFTEQDVVDLFTIPKDGIAGYYFKAIKLLRDQKIITDKEQLKKLAYFVIVVRDHMAADDNQLVINKTVDNAVNTWLQIGEVERNVTMILINYFSDVESIVGDLKVKSRMSDIKKFKF